MGLHLLLALFLAPSWWPSREEIGPVASAPIQVTLLPPPAPIRAPRVVPPENRRRIVQTSRGEEVKRASTDAFLGERTQTVDRQSVSRTREIRAGVDPGAAQAKRELREAARTESLAAKSALPRTLSVDPSLPLAGLGVPLLAPSADPSAPKPEWADVGNLPQDYVRGLNEGERTALNTKEFVFFGYFQRIRERLDRAWVPILREKIVRIYRSGRQLAAETEHTTKIMVVLNGTGEIVRVQILGESGTRDLDDAAVRAFNQAGPFPNPPRGIANAHGEIEIPWEFILRT